MKYQAHATYFTDDSTGTGLLECGGCFTRVERCYDNETKALVAVKSMPKEKRLEFNYLLSNEVNALTCTDVYQVPRVTRLIGQGLSASGDRCLILEWLIKKFTQCIYPACALRTLNHMHMDSKVCHLDLTPANIMLQSTPVNPWDAVRLIDFGFATEFNPGDLAKEGMNLKITDVKPPGATTAYASPEQLRSLQAQFEGDEDHEDFLINGHASDIYSLGVALYEMLTGELPVVLKEEHFEEDMAPDSVPEQFVEMWDEYDAMLRTQDDWESAVITALLKAETSGQPLKVDHPLLDKVRACSANPEKAADFFMWILHPISTRRLSAEACHHPYLESTYLRMLDEFPLPEGHPCHEAVLMELTADGVYVKPGQSARHTDSRRDSNTHADSCADTQMLSFSKEVAGSSAQQASEIGGVKDCNAACHSSQSSMTAQSNAKHADVLQSHLLVQHAQLPQQMHGSVQQAQHAQQAQQSQQTYHAQLPQQLQEHGSVQQAQHAPQARQTQHAQLPQQLQEQQHAQQAQHAPKACGLSAVFNMGKKRKSSKASAAAVSQGAGASGKPVQAATLGACHTDTPPHSSGKQRAMHKLKVLAKKMKPSCMQACSTGTKSDEQQEEDVQLQGLSSKTPSTAEDDSRHVQPFAASVHVDSGDGKKQVLSGASGETPDLSRLRGIFRPKKTVACPSKQASFGWARDCGADSEQEPATSSTAGSFIAAVRAPGDVEPPAEVSGSSTAIAGKPADQSKRGVKQKLANLLSSLRQ